MRWVQHSAMLAVLVPGVVVAQTTGQVTGRVTGPDGRPIASATVTVAGTTLGALTNAEGRYTVAAVPAGSRTLLARRIGFAPGTQTVTVVTGRAATADFQLTPQAVQLEQVVAIGYGTTTRRDLTGSVAVVS